MEYFLGIVFLAVAAVLFLLRPRAWLRWEKNVRGIDRTRVISDMPRWESRTRFALILGGVFAVVVAIFLFCLPTIQADKQAQREAMRRSDEREREVSHLEDRIFFLKSQLNGFASPEESRRISARIDELQRQIDALYHPAPAPPPSGTDGR